jgi:hypothetical protein
LSDTDWAQCIQPRDARPVAVAFTLHKIYGTASCPFLVTADDHIDYVIKLPLGDRQCASDHVCGLIGNALGAPVGQVRQVEVTTEFLALNPGLSQIVTARGGGASIGHATVFVPGQYDSRSFEHVRAPRNRARFALLAALFGAIKGSDHQFMYGLQQPHDVFCVDYGHCFPDGPNWNEEKLRADTSTATFDSLFVSHCQFTPEELGAALVPYRTLDPVDTIAAAIAAVRSDWGVDLATRLALAQFIHRRWQTLAALPIPSTTV